MTPKEKANELFGKFYSINGLFTEAKECALIAVDEIIYQLHVLPYGMEYLLHIDYWEGVKQQIENIKGGEQ